MGGTSAARRQLQPNTGAYGTPECTARWERPLPETSPEAAVPPSSWTDTSGNLWLFGGVGMMRQRRLLWSAISTTFGSSILPPTNGPGWAEAARIRSTGGQPASTARWERLPPETSPEAASAPHLDRQQRQSLALWGLVATMPTAMHGYLNDLWEFNPSTNEWTWMGGSSTIRHANSASPECTARWERLLPETSPEAAMRAASWTDSNGNLWLFGGYGFDANGNRWLSQRPLGVQSFHERMGMDGRKQHVASSGQPGVYGTLGTPAAGNIPGGRYGAASWTDSSGNLWLFGGAGYRCQWQLVAISTTFGSSILPPSEWAWMGGSSTIDAATAASPESTARWVRLPPETSPEAAMALRTGPTATAISGSLGAMATMPTGIWLLNDLWEFNPSTNEWAWMGGVSLVGGAGINCAIDICAVPGVYGALGTPAEGNIPGSRAGAMNWTDSKGNLWLLGGSGFGATLVRGYLNDLWEFAAMPATQVITFPAITATQYALDHRAP